MYLVQNPDCKTVFFGERKYQILNYHLGHPGALSYQCISLGQMTYWNNNRRVGPLIPSTVSWGLSLSVTCSCSSIQHNTLSHIENFFNLVRPSASQKFMHHVKTPGIWSHHEENTNSTAWLFWLLRLGCTWNMEY